MANRNFVSSRMFGQHVMPVRLDLSASIGASGAPTLRARSKGIASITRLKAGIYRIRFQDNYPQYLGISFDMEAPVTGAAVSGGAFVATTVYQIVTLGTTTQAQWVTAGVPSGITAAPGVTFLAAGVGAGTGTVQAVGPSGIVAVELVGNPQSMLSPQPAQLNLGGYVTIQCLAATSSSVTTLIPADPANGSSMNLQIWLNNSSVQ